MGNTPDICNDTGNLQCGADIPHSSISTAGLVSQSARSIDHPAVYQCRGHWILQRVEIVYSKKNLKFLFEFSVVLNCNLSTIRRPAVSQKLGNNGGLICLSVKVDCKTSARPSLLTENIFRASHLSNGHTKRNFILDNFPVALNLYLCNSQSIYRFQTNRVKECVMQYKAADFKCHSALMNYA